MTDFNAVEHSEARAAVTHGGAVVERRRVFQVRVPLRNRIDSAFHVECGRDTVARLQLHVAGRLTVRVQVDETRRNDLARDVDDFNALQRLGGHRDDLSILNGHVADAVQATRGIHYATVLARGAPDPRSPLRRHRQHGTSAEEGAPGHAR